MRLTVNALKTRLDKYLAAQIPSLSRSQIQREIEAGRVWVNGEIVKKSKFIVRKDDQIVYAPKRYKNTKSAPAQFLLKVLYDNHGLLIVDKPAGMVVHPGAGFKGETLASALAYQFKDLSQVGEKGRPGIVHRLDKDTSGVMLIAKTPAMYEYLKNAFQERKIKKEYLALVAGKVQKPHGFINTPIGKSKTDFRKYDTRNLIRAKPSLTEYWVLEYLTYPGSSLNQKKEEEGVDQYTLVRVKLHTGRTHQIRVHFKSIGHPLAGDALYGLKANRLDGLTRQFLHAHKIEVQLPASPDGSQGGPGGAWIEAESQLPADLKKVLLSLNSKVVKDL